METFSTLLALCAGNSPVPGEFPAQRPVTRSFDVFFDLHPNKRWSKQWWGWWFETLSYPLWRHRNGSVSIHSNHAGTIGHCDITIVSGRLMYRWRQNKWTFWNHCDVIKCWFKPQESHKRSVRQIHRARNVCYVLFNEGQAPRFQRR